MSILDRPLEKVRELRGDDSKVTPPERVLQRVKRGRARLAEVAPTRNECLRFWRGDQYVYVNGDNYLAKQSTVTNADGTGKPRHVVRQARNLIVDIVAREVSAATQRVPGYEVNPSSLTPDAIEAARLAEKVAKNGYDAWGVRRATVKAVTYAVVADEGFVWPYFDNTIGPFIQGSDGTVVGQGDIRLRTFGPNEVYWEPGVDFEESRWLVVETAMPVDRVFELPGYIGGALNADANSSDLLNNRYSAQSSLVLVSEYLERPSPTNPRGAWLTLANGRVIVARRDYPCVDGKGDIVDEPVVHKLSYWTDPESDRDMGLVRHLLDPQRTYNDCNNKQLEWKNLALNKQVWALPNVIQTPLTSEPGAVFTVLSLDGVKDRDPGNVPPDLENIKQSALQDMGRISAQNDIPSQIEAGKAIATFTERDQARRSDFIGNLAEWHSRLMRHCLYLVQRHFTEERLLKIRGQFGPETQPFRGSDLKSEVDVRVLPGSIEPMTRDGVLNKISTLAELFPGSFSFEKAMQAIDGASTDILGQSYEVQVQRQWREIQQMIALTATLPDTPPATDQDWHAAGVPIPQAADDDQVHLEILHSFMETDQFDQLDERVKTVLQLHEQAHTAQQISKAAQAAQAQAEVAAQQGMTNAAAPQGPDAPQTDAKPGGAATPSDAAAPAA